MDNYHLKARFQMKCHRKRSEEKKMKIQLILILATCLIVGCATHDDSRLVSITGIQLAEGQRISRVDLTISRGIVRAVHNVPPDWSVTVDGPRSGVSAVEAVAGHGVSYHTDCRAFRKFVTVQQTWSNMTVTGTATLSTRGGESAYTLSETNITME